MDSKDDIHIRLDSESNEGMMGAQPEAIISVTISLAEFRNRLKEAGFKVDQEGNIRHLLFLFNIKLILLDNDDVEMDPAATAEVNHAKAETEQAAAGKCEILQAVAAFYKLLGKDDVEMVTSSTAEVKRDIPETKQAATNVVQQGMIPHVNADVHGAATSEVLKAVTAEVLEAAITEVELAALKQVENVEVKHAVSTELENAGKPEVKYFVKGDIEQAGNTDILHVTTPQVKHAGRTEVLQAITPEENHATTTDDVQQASNADEVSDRRKGVVFENRDLATLQSVVSDSALRSGVLAAIESADMGVVISLNNYRLVSHYIVLILSLKCFTRPTTIPSLNLKHFLDHVSTPYYVLIRLGSAVSFALDHTDFFILHSFVRLFRPILPTAYTEASRSGDYSRCDPRCIYMPQYLAKETDPVGHVLRTILGEHDFQRHIIMLKQNPTSIVIPEVMRQNLQEPLELANDLDIISQVVDGEPCKPLLEAWKKQAVKYFKPHSLNFLRVRQWLMKQTSAELIQPVKQFDGTVHKIYAFVKQQQQLQLVRVLLFKTFPDNEPSTGDAVEFIAKRNLKNLFKSPTSLQQYYRAAKADRENQPQTSGNRKALKQKRMQLEEMHSTAYYEDVRTTLACN